MRLDFGGVFFVVYGDQFDQFFGISECGSDLVSAILLIDDLGEPHTGEFGHQFVDDIAMGRLLAEEFASLIAEFDIEVDSLQDMGATELKTGGECNIISLEKIEDIYPLSEAIELGLDGDARIIGAGEIEIAIAGDQRDSQLGEEGLIIGKILFDVVIEMFEFEFGGIDREELATAQEVEHLLSITSHKSEHIRSYQGDHIRR